MPETPPTPPPDWLDSFCAEMYRLTAKMRQSRGLRIADAIEPCDTPAVVEGKGTP